MRFSLGSTIVGLIMIAVGTYFIADSYNLNHKVLYLRWAEEKWGPGSGTLAYKVIGLGLISFAFFIITGLFDPFASPLDDMSGGNSGSTQPQYFNTGSGVQLSN